MTVYEVSVSEVFVMLHKVCPPAVDSNEDDILSRVWEEGRTINQNCNYWTWLGGYLILPAPDVVQEVVLEHQSEPQLLQDVLK